MSETISRLEAIPNVTVREGEPLAGHTRFGIGGPARLYVETSARDSLRDALRTARGSGMEWVVIGGGTNLIVADEGYPGIVLRYTASRIAASNQSHVVADAGADLQDLVDESIAKGLAGLHTMTGIPGSVGGAVYGNAGAYGRSIAESLTGVTFLDAGDVRGLDNAGCEFRYRESVFKRRKDWIILSASFRLEPGDAVELRRIAGGILEIRNQKYPPTMKCAGSIFKNLILSELSPEVQARVPGNVIREGKVPSAYFLEQAGAKGMRVGGIRVAEYHANLIYNDGGGTAQELREVIGELKRRVLEAYGLDLEEEVQYVGFSA